VAVERLHNVVEDLREHRGGEEADRPERFRAGVNQVMPNVGRQYEDAAWSDREDAVVSVQFPGSRDAVLGLLGLIGVPAEPASRLDLEDNRRRLVRAVSPLGHESALPANGIVAIPVDLRARQVESRDRVHTIPFHSDTPRQAGAPTDTAHAEPIVVVRTRASLHRNQVPSRRPLALLARPTLS
jgi:hypothetical protein